MAVLVMDNDSLEIKAYAGRRIFPMIPDTRTWIWCARAFAGFHAQAPVCAGAGRRADPFGKPVDRRAAVLRLRAGQFPGRFLGADQRGPGAAAVPECPGVDLLDRVGPVSFASVMLAGGCACACRPAPTQPERFWAGGTTLEELVGATGRWRAAACRASPVAAGAARVESRMMSAGAAWIVRDILESGGHPTARSMNRAIRAAAGLEDRHQFRFPRCLVGRRDRQMDDRRVGRSSGRHPNPGFSAPMWRRRALQDIVAALPKARRSPDPAGHGASRRDVLAAGLGWQRPDRSLSRAARAWP